MIINILLPKKNTLILHHTLADHGKGGYFTIETGADGKSVIKTGYGLYVAVDSNGHVSLTSKPQPPDTSFYIETEGIYIYMRNELGRYIGITHLGLTHGHHVHATHHHKTPLERFEQIITKK